MMGLVHDDNSSGVQWPDYVGSRVC